MEKYIHLNAINACYKEIGDLTTKKDYYNSEIECYVSQNRQVPKSLQDSLNETEDEIKDITESIGVLKSYGKK